MFAVLLALVLRNACEQVFNELAVTVFAEFKRRGFKDAARFADRCTKFEMGLYATGEAADIVDDHNMRLASVLT
nr:hypothetical protein [Sneathiella sp.]